MHTKKSIDWNYIKSSYTFIDSLIKSKKNNDNMVYNQSEDNIKKAEKDTGLKLYTKEFINKNAEKLIPKVISKLDKKRALNQDIDNQIQVYLYDKKGQVNPIYNLIIVGHYLKEGYNVWIEDMNGVNKLIIDWGPHNIIRKFIIWVKMFISRKKNEYKRSKL